MATREEQKSSGQTVGKGSGQARPHLPVTVSLQDLERENVPFSSLEDAFGPSSLGIIIVKGLSERFVALRSTVLSYSSFLAGLPDAELEKLENPHAKYLVGWSLGKETLKSVPDFHKGSYYINCAFYNDRALQAAPSDQHPDFPEYTSPNIWPAEEVLRGFRQSCEELCTLIIDTAVLVAKACDRYGEEKIPNYESAYLEKTVKTSMTTKARLLHYFPTTLPNGIEQKEQEEDDDDDDWCATHVDHGCLTGLTSAMYIDEACQSSKIASASQSKQAFLDSLLELPKSPDPSAGLYIHSRTGEVTQVRIPPDCLAFQTGEALELITQGYFKAVPHYVKGISKRFPEGEGVARNTLAVFTQPNLWEIVDKERNLDFAGFAKEVVQRTY